MKKTFLFSLIASVCAMLCGCSSSPSHVNDIPDVNLSYKIKDNVTGDEYQVVTIRTIPNKEYEIKPPMAKNTK